MLKRASTAILERFKGVFFLTDKIGKLGYSGLIIMLACGMTIFKSWQFDNDAWFILNCGRYVVETGTIPHEEFATMHEGLNYIMEQWLTAVIFWKIFSNFGADGLITFTCFTGFILMFVYFKLCLYVSGGNKKISVILSLVIGLIVSILFIVTRPQIFSTLILLLEVFLLEKFVRDKKIWTLCLLPVMAIIFINLHAALFPMMIVVLLPYIAESFVLNFKKISTPFLPLVLVGIGIFLAGFLNPYGWEAMSFVFYSYDSSIHKNISEIKAPTADNFFGIIFFIFSALLIIVQTKKKLPIRYFFLSFGLMILASQMVRGVFLFLILGTFPLAYAFKDWQPFDKIFNLRHKLFIPLFLICIPEFYRVYILAQNSIWEMHLPMKIIFTLSIIFLVCFIFFYRREGKLFSEEIFILRRKPLIALVTLQMIIFVSVAFYSTPNRKYEPYKPAADILLSKNRAEDIILWTGFNSGGYFEFRGIKTYFDARPEIFSLANNHKKEITAEYFELKDGDLDYKEFFARYNFTHIFITTEDIISYLLLSQDKNYRLLFEYDFQNNGGHGRIFVPVKKND